MLFDVWSWQGCDEVPNVGRTKGLELVHHLVKFLTLKNFHMSFAILIEQIMCQECSTHIQGDYKDFSVKAMRNLTFYQNFDFFQSLPTHIFCNKVFMCAKMNCSSWKRLKFMDNIVYSIGASIHIERTCNTKPTNNCTYKRSLCKLISQGNLGKITDPTYFVSNNKMQESLLQHKCPKHLMLLNPKPKLFLMLEVFTLHQAWPLYLRSMLHICLEWLVGKWMGNSSKMMLSLNVMGKEETYLTLILL